MADIFIIGGQKGGPGKSLITTLIANFIALFSKIKILVLDADDTQKSMSMKRAKEIAEGIYTKEEAPYPIISCSSKEVPDLIKEYSDQYDIIMVDVPGNLKQKGVSSAYVLANFILLPFKPDFLNRNSLDTFLDILDKDIKPLQKKLGVQCKMAAFLNNVPINDKEVKKILASGEDYRDGIPIFKTMVHRSIVHFEREFNTFKVYKDPKDNKRLDPFYKEVFKFIG